MGLWSMFFNFRSFVNNFIYLWPIYALLLSLIFIVVRFILMWLKIACDKSKREKEYKLQVIVTANSEWYQNVLDLNNQTKFYTDVADQGRSVYYLNVDNKTRFNRTEPIDALYEYLSLYRPKVERALEQVNRNRVIDEVYRKRFQELHSIASEDICTEVGISFEKFVELERKSVNEAKLIIAREYSISCYVKYTSPQGRKRYSKHKVFNESDIRIALERLDRQTEYQATEEFRRKNERAKVTPSLRYDVIQRDGGRCRVCGRSAADGVTLEVDHIIPISKGGTTTYTNLQTLCKDCNRGKSAKV